MLTKKLSKITLSLFLSCASLIAISNSAFADPIKIYWGNTDGNVYKANPDGTNVELIQTIAGTIYGLDVDSKNQKLYIATLSDIIRTNLDGSNPEIIHSLYNSGSYNPETLVSINYFSDVAVDMKAGHLYYSNYYGTIGRIDLDGSNNITLVSNPNVTINTPSPYISIAAIDLDLKNGKIYWADEHLGKIQRSNLDGTEIEDVIPEDSSSKRGVACDPYNNEVYYSDANLGEINKIVFATNQGNRLIQGLGQAYHIDVDALGGKMYYTDNAASSVFKANLDGSSAEGITGGHGFLTGIALELEPDLDFDGTPASTDSCDLDELKTSPGVCGCGVADLDANRNQVIDCLNEDQPMTESLNVFSELEETNFRNGISDNLLSSYKELVAKISSANLEGYKKDLRLLRRAIIRLNFLKNVKNNQEEFKTILAKANKTLKKIQKKLSKSSKDKNILG